MVKYGDVIGKGVFSEDVLASIPRYCACGAELEFSDNFVNIGCPNRFCHLRVGARLFAMCKKMQEIGMGVPEGFGEGTCNKLAEICSMESPAEICGILEAPDSYPEIDIVSWEAKKETMRELLKSPIEFWQYVLLLNLPKVATITKALFGSFDNPNDFFEALGEDTKAVKYISAQLGISTSNESGVLAVNVYNTLMEHREEIETWYEYFNIVRKPTEEEVGGEIYTLNVCATGTPKGYSTKFEFFKELKKHETDRLKVEKVESVTKDTHVLVADPSSTTGKTGKAKKMNEKACKQVIFIGEPDAVMDFVDELASKLQV